MSQPRTAALCVVASLAAVAVAASPVVAGFKSGQYVGTTSQVNQIGQSLDVGLDVPRNKKKVTIVYFEYRNIDCNNITQVAGEKARIKKSGKFNFEPADGVFGSGYIKGKFKGGEASGTAEFPDRCASEGVIKWEAKE
jgi:hypothetical protein